MPKVNGDKTIKTKSSKDSLYCQKCGRPTSKFKKIPYNKGIDTIVVCSECHAKYMLKNK